MFFAEVTEMYAPDGNRLLRSERAPPMRGMVTIGEMNRTRETSESYAVVVDLWEQHGTPRMRCMAHMSGPRILPNPKVPGMLISGVQRETWRDDAGKLRMKEHRQVWHVVPVQRDGDE